MNTKKLIILCIFLFVPRLAIAGTMTVSGNTDDYCMSRGSTPDVFAGLVFRAPMNQGNGSAVRDVSSYSANGTITGATWANVGGRRCMYFDGINDYVTIPYNTATNIEGSKSVSLVAWVYPVSQEGTNKTIIKKERFVSSTDRGGFLLRIDNAFPKFTVANNDGTNITSSTALGTATWNFVCATYNINNGSMKIYINNTQVAAGTKTSGIGTHSVANIRLSDAGSERLFEAYLDDARIYDLALSETEISNIYNAIK